MKKCPYCGKDYLDDATVCAIDQTPLTAAGQTPSAAAAPQTNAAVKTPSTFLDWAALVCVGSPFVTVIVGLVLLKILSQHPLYAADPLWAKTIVGSAFFLQIVCFVVSGICVFKGGTRHPERTIAGAVGLIFNGVVGFFTYFFLVMLSWSFRC